MTDHKEMRGRAESPRYSLAYDEDGDPVTRFPNGCYVNRHVTGAVLNELNRLLDALDEQQKVIEKLPMTADGVRVVPGMQIWTMHPFGETHHKPPYMVQVAHVWEPNGGADCGESSPRGKVSCKLPAGVCYSTREAAEAAREGE